MLASIHIACDEGKHGIRVIQIVINHYEVEYHLIFGFGFRREMSARNVSARVDTGNGKILSESRCTQLKAGKWIRLGRVSFMFGSPVRTIRSIYQVSDPIV